MRKASLDMIVLKSRCCRASWWTWESTFWKGEL